MVLFNKLIASFVLVINYKKAIGQNVYEPNGFWENNFILS